MGVDIVQALKVAAALSWPYFVAVLVFMLFYFALPKVKGWHDLWRCLTMAAALVVLTFSAFALYRAFLRDAPPSPPPIRGATVGCSVELPQRHRFTHMLGRYRRVVGQIGDGARHL